MKQFLGLIALCFICISSHGQSYTNFGAFYNNSSDKAWDCYITNTGPAAYYSPKLWRFYDTCREWHLYMKNIFLDTAKSRDNGVPGSEDKLMWVNASDGKLMMTKASDWYNKSQTDTIVTGLTIFIDDRVKYSDTGAIIATKSYLASQGYLTSFTELDPTVPAHVKSISIGDISSWNTKFNTPSGNTSQYLRGDGSLASFPSIPASQVNSDWASVSGVSQILNKPTLGTAATANITDFATSAQGLLASSALQPTGNGSSLTGITKSQVGLSNVDNTADANKNVLSATKLTTARTINGVSFDGTSNITIPGPSWTVNNNVSRSIVTVAAAANGWQISSTRNSDVRYSVTISTSVSLAGNSSGYVVLEVSSTNSTTASDWVEVARSSSGQSGTLVIGLSLNQIGGGEVSASILPGYYCRLRSVNVAGTPIYSLNSNQEILK